MVGFAQFSTCQVFDSLSISPNPTNGYYSPGTTVHFCYTVYGFFQTGSNWFHCLIPEFNNEWDTSTFNIASLPVSADGQGYWNWYDTSITSSASGIAHAPGFYYESGYGGGISLDNNPGNNYGDFCISGNCNWTFCWSLKTKSVVPCFSIDSLKMNVFHFGDGTTGAWASNSCPNEAPFEYNSLLHGSTACPKPTNPFTTVLSHTKAKLNWTTQPCVIGYKIRIRKVGTSTWTNVIVGTNIGFKTINTFTPNTTYEWQVRSICQQTPLIQSAFTALQTFTTPLRMEDENEVQNNFTIYPNPSTNTINISSSSLSGKYSLKIYNLLGQQVKQQEIDFSFEGSSKVNIESLASGYYQLMLVNGSNVVSKRFVIADSRGKE